MEDWLDEFDHGLGLDGFWELYKMSGEKWVKVFDLHDDQIPSGMDDDERLLYLVNAWDAQTNPD